MSSVCLGVSLDDRFARHLQRELSVYELKPYFVDTERTALSMLEQWQFQAVVIDADGFPDSIFPFLEHVGLRSATPVLLMSSPFDEDREIDLLDQGAAEILAKPVSPRLLSAKLRRLVSAPRTSEVALRGELRLGPLVLNPRRALARVDGNPLALTASEFNLLFLLASRPGDYISRDAIADVLPNQSAATLRRSADMHVCRLRLKLREAGAAPLCLESAYGRGYRLRFVSARADAAANAMSIALG